MGMIALVGYTEEGLVCFNDAREHSGLFGNGIENLVPPEKSGIPMDANLFGSIAERILVDHAGENGLDLLIVQLGRGKNRVGRIRERLVAVVADIALLAVGSAIAGNMRRAAMRAGDAVLRAFSGNGFVEID